MQDPELLAWLGPVVDDLTAEQIDTVEQQARRIAEFWPDPDEQDQRDAALSAVVQHLLGEITPDEARRDLINAERARARARAVATWAGVMLVRDAGGRGKSQAARAAGIDRQWLLEALGEKPRRRNAARRSTQEEPS